MTPFSGHLPCAWRLPSTDPAHAGDLETIARLAQLAESGCFDSIFLADSQSLMPTFVYEEMRTLPDPLVLLGALAARTTHIGLIATVYTEFSTPYDLARKFATLDHISGGRAGCNFVTGSMDADALNHGTQALADPVTRYDRAAEFVDVAKELWMSWDDDALLYDKDSGIYADPARVHAINHEGRYFRCAGPLSVPASPQRFPVIVQAGQSEPGRDFAARHAEVIFTAQSDLDDAVAFANDIRSRARRHGRDPAEIAILPGLIPVIGPTEAEARELDRELRETVSPQQGFEQIRIWCGVDLSGYDLDDPVPGDPDVLVSLAVDNDPNRNTSSRGATMLERARRENATVRQLMFTMGARAHGVVVGTGEQVADKMAEWFEAGACDGFNVAPALLPRTLEDFVDEVIPALRERDLFREKYSGDTLRDHLGLVRPQSPRALARG
jgi:FMN-dependent oxidoreductase (nitrilotriacetate monooxygenase family)